MKKKILICVSIVGVISFIVIILFFLRKGSSQYLLIGDWSDPKEDPLGSFLILRKDNTFIMGDIDNNRRFPGLFGTWNIKGEILQLKIKKSESCKINEGEEINIKFRLINNDELELSSPDSDDGKAIFRRTSQIDKKEKP
jgi:hypothetical protein